MPVCCDFGWGKAVPRWWRTDGEALRCRLVLFEDVGGLTLLGDFGIFLSFSCGGRGIACIVEY